MNDYMRWAENYIKNIPQKLKICMITTFAVGIIAHMFVYANPMYIWDDTYIYREPITLAEAATASRWIGYFFDIFLGTVKMPWLYGLLCFILYGFSAFMIVEVLDIKRPLSISLVSAIMVTCPTFTSGNLFIGSTVQYTCGLLFACLAAYMFYRTKHRYFWCALCFLLCEACYAAYISVALALFLLKSLLDFHAETDDNFKNNFITQIKYAAVCLFTMLLTFVLMKLMTSAGGVQVQGRVSLVEQRSVKNWIIQVFDTYARAVFVYLPLGKSYFWGNKILFCLFWITLLYAVYLYFKIIKENKEIGKNRLLILLDILVFPLAINVVGMLFISHDLMRWAFITPWIFFIAFHDNVVANICTEKEIKVNSFLALMLSVVTIVNGVYIANMAYIKEYAVYESSMQLTTRIAERIESVEGYVPGETPVYIIGTPRELYEIKRKPFDYIVDLTGSYDIGMGIDVKAYLTEQAGLPMNIIAAYWDGTGISPGFYLHSVRNDVDEERFDAVFEESEKFPSVKCVFWYDDILTIRLSDLEIPAVEVKMDLPHKIEAFFEDLMK